MGRIKRVLDCVGRRLEAWRGRASGRSIPVVMFHRGRCGSTVLATQLDQHSQVGWAGEVLLEHNLVARYGNGFPRPVRPLAVARDAMRTRGQRFFGFEVQPNQVRELGCGAEEYVAGLRQLGVEHFVLLERRNALRALVSAAVSEQSKRWAMSGNDQPRLFPVTLDVAAAWGFRGTLVEYLAQEHEHVQQTFEQLLATTKLLSLTYESHIERDPEVSYRLVCEHLSIEPEPVEIRLRRVNPYPLSELLLNFDEVEAALRGSRFEWMTRGGT